MARRPALTNESFLSHVFHPKTSPLPTGLRKRKITSIAGRKKARVTAFNKMSADKQEILIRSGQRDAYLKGESTLVKARQTLREQAVKLGIAKPVKRRGKVVIVQDDANRLSLQVLQWAIQNLPSPNEQTLMRMIPHMTDRQQREVLSKGFTVAQWKYRAAQAQNIITGVEHETPETKRYVAVNLNGDIMSPYFYH